MTTYYVATNGSDSGKGTSGSPWKTISKAMKAVKAGDEVVVKSGTYKEAVAINKDGVTLRSEVPGGANIDPPSGKLGININANNVEVRGFEIYGSTTAGITANGVHHVKIIDNIVHDNMGNGILAMKSDFITIDGNVVYGNASIGSKSGISVFHPVASGGDGGGFRIIIRNNVSYNNVNKTGAHTDGNGIILDDFNSTQDSKLKAYKYPTLIENNLVYQNGGAGIMVFKSENATIRGNTAFQNQQDNHSSRGTWRTELQTQASDNITWINNVAVANKAVNKFNEAIGSFSFTAGDKNTGVSWSGNYTFNGKNGDSSVSINYGNAGPNGSNNKLGQNPGLTLSEVKSMAAKLGASTSTASQKVVVDSASAGSDTVQTVAPEKTTDKVLVGKAGNDNLAGGAGNDKITGNAGNDKLTGNAGNDKLFGNAGNDKLFGGAGADTLDGGNGKDVLQGGTGKDVLLGGGGADDFVFKSVAEAGKGGGRDVIRDFSHGQGDDIHLAAIDANSKVAGNQAFSFIGEKAFSGKAGQLQYKNGLVAGDVNGDKVADFHIEIANHAALHANDFIL